MSEDRERTTPAATTGSTAPAGRATIEALGLTGGVGGAAESANAFLYAWFQLFKTAQIHAIDNEALVRPVRNFIAAAGGVVEREGRISFQAKDQTLFQNSVKLKLTTDEYALAYDIFEFFEARGMGGFTIEGTFDEASVRRLLEIMVYAPAPQRRFAAIAEALLAAAIPMRVNKTLGRSSRGRSEVVLERRGYTFFTYSKLVVLYRSLLVEENLNATRRQFLLKKISRTIQSLVDICLEDDHTFLGISSVKSAEAYAPHHAANTAVLAIALGEKLGMSKVDLADLGMAALLCDVGFRAVPPEISQKQGALTDEEKAVVQSHPLHSVEFLLEERAFSRTLLASIAVAYEHHRWVDGSGYPSMQRAPDLFSRIVAIAEAYDALTTDRPWGRAYLPDEALGHMIAEGGRHFDAGLLKVFVNALGLYPVGTLVRLSTGELAVVVYGGGDGERATRPIVALLDSKGQPTRSVDVAEKDAGGGYLRSIARSEDPTKYGLQPSGLVAASPVV